MAKYNLENLTEKQKEGLQIINKNGEQLFTLVERLFEFRQKKMGPVIGTRTWGGLVGVSMFIRLIDGGGLTAPDYRIYSPDGKWVVENTGVEPDIVIDLTPEEMARGYDAQLMKGVEVLMDKIKKDPRPWPRHKAFKADK